MLNIKKKVWNSWKKIHFLVTDMKIISHQPALEGSTAKIIFFFNVLCGKVKKYRFWLQKVVKIQNQYHFWKLWRLIIYEFQRFSRQLILEGSTAKSIFFFIVLCRKAEKWQNVFFGYKKWSKSKSDDILRSVT